MNKVTLESQYNKHINILTNLKKELKEDIIDAIKLYHGVEKVDENLRVNFDDGEFVELTTWDSLNINNNNWFDNTFPIDLTLDIWIDVLKNITEKIK